MGGSETRNIDLFAFQSLKGKLLTEKIGGLTDILRSRKAKERNSWNSSERYGTESQNRLDLIH